MKVTIDDEDIEITPGSGTFEYGGAWKGELLNLSFSLPHTEQNELMTCDWALSGVDEAKIVLPSKSVYTLYAPARANVEFDHALNLIHVKINQGGE